MRDRAPAPRCDVYLEGALYVRKVLRCVSGLASRVLCCTADGRETSAYPMSPVTQRANRWLAG